jgi:hypothetical protein
MVLIVSGRRVLAFCATVLVCGLLVLVLHSSATLITSLLVPEGMTLDEAMRNGKVESPEGWTTNSVPHEERRSSNSDSIFALKSFLNESERKYATFWDRHFTGRPTHRELSTCYLDSANAQKSPVRPISWQRNWFGRSTIRDHQQQIRHSWASYGEVQTNRAAQWIGHA